MRIRPLAGLLAPAVMALASCGGEERSEIADFVEIDSVAPPIYRSTIALGGSRSRGAHTVAWLTDTGASGTATLTFQRNCSLAPFFPIVVDECNHRWSASVPLNLGTNNITVIGEGSDGDWGQARITIARLPCPLGFSPAQCS
jgi:hypothetical protein